MEEENKAQIKAPVPAVTPEIKTPISLLQEWCAQKGVTSKFEVISVEGAVHAPTFVYRVAVLDMVATAPGQSKKKAKHAAAKAILTQIMADPKDKNSISEEVFKSKSNMNQLAVFDDGIAGNPVGQLQELCMERGWPPPFYDMVSEDGVPHDRYFSIVCKVGKIRETGSGKSKKLAKRQAAHKLLCYLTDKINKKESVINDEYDIIDKLQIALDLDANIPTISHNESQRIRTFHEELKASPGATLKAIQSTDLQPDKTATILLEKISQENRFNITYVDIEQKSYHGKFQCLVQLATQPVAVCYGDGDTVMDARASAAFDALNYLHIMTKL